MQLKQIAKVGYVLPGEESKETEKALRRIATKGGSVLFVGVRCSDRVVQRSGAQQAAESDHR